jgi:hypothetical protein
MKHFFITYQDVAKTQGLVLSTRIKNYLSQAEQENLVPLKKFLLPENKFSIGKIKREDYEEEGMFPIVDQSKDFIVGYSDESDLVYNGNLPVVVFGDHTRVFKYVDFPFIQGADGIQIIAPNPEAVNPKFFYYLINHIGVPSRAYNRHFSILKKQKYPTIPRTIQDNIIEKIEPIEREIKRLQDTISNPAEAISQVFADELAIDIEAIREKQRQQPLNVSFEQLAQHSSLRSDFKHHLNIPLFNQVIEQIGPYRLLSEPALEPPTYLERQRHAFCPQREYVRENISLQFRNPS